MKITSKNLIIIMIMIFLIFNHFVGLAWEVVKTVIFSILFLYLLSFISPDLYESIMNTLNLKKLIMWFQHPNERTRDEAAE